MKLSTDEGDSEREELDDEMSEGVDSSLSPIAAAMDIG
jgi:hypothetical protein